MENSKLNQEAIQALKEGLDKAVNFIKVTMGAKGKYLHIDTPNGYHSTLDGVTGLAVQSDKDKIKNLGIKMVQEVGIKQVDDCGDGTTSVSVLLQALIEKGLKMMTAGADPIKVKKGIVLAAEEGVKIIRKSAKDVKRNSKEIEQIARVSAHGDSDVSKLIAEAIAMTNENSIIRVEEATPGSPSRIDLAKGMKVPSGWLAKEFINNKAKGVTEYDNPFIFVYEGKIDKLAHIQHLLEPAHNSGKGLIIVSDNMDGEVLSSLAVNAVNGFKFAAINPWGENRDDMKDRLMDLALYTGAKFISPDLGHDLQDVTIEDLGTCENATLSREYSVFKDGKGLGSDELLDRISDLKSLIKNEEHGPTKTFLESRLAALNGGVATIFVGGIIDSEVDERKDRIDDAVGAALSALEEGVVPGGGISLLHVAKELGKNKVHEDTDVQIGINIFKEAIAMPIRQILLNAGLNPDSIIEKINENKSKSYGYNLYTDEYVDMVKEGILDPAKVEIKIIENATAAATKFLNTGGVIAND